MKIPLPSLPPRVRAIFDRYLDWVNVAIWTRGRIEIRRLDVLLVLMGILIAIYYLVVYSWQTALIGIATYILMVMVALWMF
jgi:hypothetical protein